MSIKSIILWIVFIFIEKTCSWKYHGEERLREMHSSNYPVLICLWHGYFIFPMIFLKRNYSFSKVVSSTHKDSMVLAAVLQKFGFSLIKGSSSRGAKNVLKKIILEVNEINKLAIKLYKKNDFVLIGKRKNYYNINGKLFDAILMQLMI